MHNKRCFRLLRAGIGTVLTAFPAFAYADPISLISFAVSALSSAGIISAGLAFGISLTASLIGTVQARKKAKRADRQAREEYNAKLEDRSVTALRGLPARRIVYGRCIVGGDVVAIFTTDKTVYRPAYVGIAGVGSTNTYSKVDAYKHLVVIVASHEVEAINEIYIDGEALGTLDLFGAPTDPKWTKSIERSVDLTMESASFITTDQVNRIVAAYRVVWNAATGYENQEAVVATITSGNTINIPSYTFPNVYRVSYVAVETEPSVRISKFLGSPSQPVNSYLHGLLPLKWTVNHQLRGLAGFVITLDLEEQRFQGGPPGITADVSGKKIFDPRTGTVVWSDNSALCASDFLESKEGYFVDRTLDINSAYTIAAANACDQIINLNVGGVVTASKRYTCNGMFTTADNKEAVLADIVRSMAGSAIQSSQWLLTAGVWTAPVATLNDTDLDGQIEIVQNGQGLDNLFNGIRATHIERGKSTPTDLEPYQNPTFVTVDEEELWESLSYPFTDNRARGKNLSRIFVEQNRQGMVIRYPAKLSAWELAVGERLYVNSAEYGFVNKIFRITDWQFGLGSPVTLLLQEDVATAYDEADATTIDESPNSGLPDPNFVPEIPSIVITSGNDTLVKLRDGSILPRVKVAWADLDADGAFMNDGGAVVCVKWRVSGEEAFKTVTAAPIEGFLYIEGVREGQYIILEIFGVNSFSRRGSPKFYGHYVVGKNALPPAFDVFSVTTRTDGTRVVNFGYSNMANQPLDWLGADIRYVAGTTGSPTWATMTKLQQEGTLYAASPAELYVPIAAGAYTFAIRSVDTSGNASAMTVVNVTLPVGRGDANSAISTLTEIANDNLITPGEKPPLILDYSNITSEQSGIDAQATAYGITTEKTAYDNAVSALTTYLGTLTSPVAWNNLTGNTTIVGTTFRSTWATVYSTRQALLNKIASIAPHPGNKLTAGNITNYVQSGAVGTTQITPNAATRVTSFEVADYSYAHTNSFSTDPLYIGPVSFYNDTGADVYVEFTMSGSRMISTPGGAIGETRFVNIVSVINATDAVSVATPVGPVHPLNPGQSKLYTEAQSFLMLVPSGKQYNFYSYANRTQDALYGSGNAVTRTIQWAMRVTAIIR